MHEVPSMWRTELWHPLSVHFPIGILSLAAVVGIVYLFIRKQRFAFYLRFSLSLLLWSGIVLFWIAFYTGELAYSVVVRTLCDPRVLKDHLYWAYVSGISFSVATALDLLFRIFSLRFQRWLTYGAILFMLIGVASISYVGHLGAKVVYQQAGAVYRPSQDCYEFE